MATSHGARPNRPQKVAELVSQAENFNFNINVPFKRWTRSAETLYQEAKFALSDDDYGRAYILLYRYSVLVINNLPTHPHFKDPESREAFLPLKSRLKRVVSSLEELRPVINAEYAEWERMRPQAPSVATSSRPPSSYGDFAARDPSLSGNAKILDASENQELAVELAQKELARRDTVRQANRHAKVYGDTLLSGGYGEQRKVDMDMQRQMEAVRRATDSSGRKRFEKDHGSNEMPAGTPPQHYSYPALLKSRPVDYENSESRAREPARQPPNRPPKESLQHLPPRDSSFRGQPILPPKYPLDSRQPLARVPSLLPNGPPDAPGIPKKERLAFKPGAYLENGDPIRSIFLPTRLRQAFLELAADNTRKGLEMCGIICGTPINNALFVRCLLIPDQISTSDTCETENESAVFDYCAEEDLLVLGWIHTHPTQTCFMSSRDLHTHAGYQVMMPESIAIVCAPKFTPSYGIFRLTHPPGLDHILDCRQTETFHQHSIGNLYRETEHPSGHVYESDKMPLDIKDVRTK